MSDTEPPTTDGRQRLLQALRRPGRGQTVAGVLLAVVGFAGVTQVHSNESDDQYSGLRTEDLIQVLNGLSAASQRADNEIARLQQTRNSLRSSTDARAAALTRAREEADTLGILAGTLPATGPGIEITVRDPTGEVGINQLLNGVEELRDAGAEAIEINDRVRVVAQTSFEDGTGGVIVDGIQLSPPYTLDVIGDPATLNTILDFAGGFTDEIKYANGSVRSRELDAVDITSIRQITPAQYAQPVAGQ